MESLLKWTLGDAIVDDAKIHYTEKCWPLPPEKATVITIKGKNQDFIDATLKMKEVMKKGAETDVNGVKAKILDVKVKNKLTETVIEINEGPHRGNAILEVFEPQKRNKNCSVVIKKPKGHDEKYVSTVANKIVKPYIDRFAKQVKSSEVTLEEIAEESNSSLEKNQNVFETSEVESDLPDKSPKDYKRKRNVVNYAESDESMEWISNEDEHMEVELDEKKSSQIQMIAKEMKDVAKQRKQKTGKTEREIKRCKTEVKQTAVSKNNFKSKKIKGIPSKYLEAVGKDKVIYTVKGDGSCAASCAALHLFNDDIYGHKLRRQMNIFMAKHFETKYSLLTNCSPETPYKRRVGLDKEISFHDKDDLCDYLKNSEESDLVWCDSEDLAVLSDMYQMSIKVITVGRSDGKITTNIIHPDEDMKQHSYVEERTDDLVLLHENENHFDLIIPKKHNLALEGSISEKLENKENTSIVRFSNTKRTDHVELEEKDKINIEKEVEKLSEELKMVKKTYADCAKDLKKKTEDFDKINGELQSSFLKDNLEKAVIKTTDKIKTKQCNLKAVDMNKGSVYVNQKRVENNCQDCDFQADGIWQLNKHRNLKHCTEASKEKVACRDCKKEFADKSTFMVHRKKEHRNNVGMCRKFIAGQCPFSDDYCWWAHSKNNDIASSTRTGDTNRQCNHCGTTFEDLRNLMQHRKVEHEETIPLCRKFKANECKFNEMFCWYRHLSSNQLDFQKVTENLDPPCL